MKNIFGFALLLGATATSFGSNPKWSLDTSLGTPIEVVLTGAYSQTPSKNSPTAQISKSFTYSINTNLSVPVTMTISAHSTNGSSASISSASNSFVGWHFIYTPDPGEFSPSSVDEDIPVTYQYSTTRTVLATYYLTGGNPPTADGKATADSSSGPCPLTSAIVTSLDSGWVSMGGPAVTSIVGPQVDTFTGAGGYVHIHKSGGVWRGYASCQDLLWTPAASTTTAWNPLNWAAVSATGSADKTTIYSVAELT